MTQKQTNHKCQACGIVSNHVVNGRCRVTIQCFARWAKQQQEAYGLTGKVAK